MTSDASWLAIDRPTKQNKIVINKIEQNKTKQNKIGIK